MHCFFIFIYLELLELNYSTLDPIRTCSRQWNGGLLLTGQGERFKKW